MNVHGYRGPTGTPAGSGQVSLSGLVGSTLDHRRVPAPVDRRLRIAAAAGLGLSALAGSEAVLDALTGWPAQAHPGVYLFGWALARGAFSVAGHPTILAIVAAVVCAAGLVGAAVTRGYTRAGMHGQIGLFILLLTGMTLAVPLAVAVAITAINVAVWAALVLLGAFIVGVILMALLDSL